MALESRFQRELREDLEHMFPGCFIMKLDPGLYGQGIPDLLILFEGNWAMLEVKRDELAKYRPNQPWYLNKFNDMSFAARIEPENRDEVLHALESALRA